MPATSPNLTKEVRGFIEDRPHLTRRQVAKLYYWNVVKVIREKTPATELELHGWLKLLEKRR